MNEVESKVSNMSTNDSSSSPSAVPSDHQRIFPNLEFTHLRPSPVTTLLPDSDTIMEDHFDRIRTKARKEVPLGPGHLTKTQQEFLDSMISQSNAKNSDLNNVKLFWLHAQRQYAAAASCFAQRAVFLLCIKHWQGSFDLGAFGGPRSFETFLRTLLLQRFHSTHHDWLHHQELSVQSSFVDTLTGSICRQISDRRAADSIVDVALLQLRRASAQGNKKSAGGLRSQLSTVDMEDAHSLKLGLTLASTILGNLSCQVIPPWPLVSATRSLIQTIFECTNV